MFNQIINETKKLNHLGGYHHMGGTRIGYTEKDGVVDKNLKFLISTTFIYQVVQYLELHHL